jgi:hypothetical protein
MIFNLKEISNNLNKFEINQSDDVFQNEEMDGYLSPSPDYMQLSNEQKISPKNANQPTPSSSSNTSVTNLIQQYESSTTSAVTAANKIRLNSSEEEEEESTIYSFYFFFLIIKFLLKKTI